MKFGLLYACNYKETPYELNGCINDANRSHDWLKTVNKYDNLQLWTDDTQEKPTRENIISSLMELVSKVKEKDFIFIHFSGHGTQIKDTSGDERDEKDEVFVSLDLKGIVDDEMATILKAIPKGVNVFILMDCCHSGTIVDLPYSIYQGRGYNIANSNNHFDANIYMLSGCRDDQVSYDAFISNRYQGAMTNAFYTAVRNRRSVHVRYLLGYVQYILFRQRYPQRPQLSSSVPIRWDSVIKFA